MELRVNGLIQWIWRKKCLMWTGIL